MANASGDHDGCQFDQIVEYNRTHRAAPAATPDPAESSGGLCVIACHDPRLTRLFRTALGLERGDVVLLRVPGAGLLPNSTDLLRVVAAAVFLNGCSEVLVLGHTDCAAHRVGASAVIDAMAARGVPRDAVPGDVREFFGLRSDVRATVLETAGAIRDAQFLPRGLRVHAAILDTHTGELTVLEHGSQTATPVLPPPGPVRMDPTIAPLAAPGPVSWPSAFDPSAFSEPSSAGTPPLVAENPPALPAAEKRAAPMPGHSAVPTAKPSRPAVGVAAREAKDPQRKIAREVANAIAQVREFCVHNVPPRTRASVAASLPKMAGAGVNAPDLVSVVARLVEDTGAKRTQVQREMAIIRQATEGLPPDQAARVLQHVLG